LAQRGGGGGGVLAVCDELTASELEDLRLNVLGGVGLVRAITLLTGGEKFLEGGGEPKNVREIK